MDEIRLGDQSRVLVGRSIAASDVLGDATPERVMFVTQPAADGFARTLAAGMPCHAEVAVVPDGEAAKTFAVVEHLVERLAAFGMDRSGLVVGVGGGSVTDLAGFVAAIYLRGVGVHLVPTTLLGAIDAAIGGKTAINAGAKNAVGVFRHPGRVIVDLGILEALPTALLREGAAEAVKAGFIGDAGLVDLYEAHGVEAPVAEVVRRAIAVKAGIVRADFTEGGVRAHLNYGHTVGHAVEVVAGCSHGEAVAVGMVAAAHASHRVLGFDGEDRHRSIIGGIGLPVRRDGLDPDRVAALIERDKKRIGARTRMVLLADIGAPQVITVDGTTVRAALGAVGIGGDTT